MPKAIDNLKRAAKTFEERSKVYGDNYLIFGEWADKLFPNGVTIKGVDQWNRWGIILQILSKLSRYAQNPNKGHIDSIHDAGVYCFMLEELDTMHLEPHKPETHIWRLAHRDDGTFCNAGMSPCEREKALRCTICRGWAEPQGEAPTLSNGTVATNCEHVWKWFDNYSREFVEMLIIKTPHHKLRCVACGTWKEDV